MATTTTLLQITEFDTVSTDDGSGNKVAIFSGGDVLFNDTITDPTTPATTITVNPTTGLVSSVGDIMLDDGTGGSISLSTSTGKVKVSGSVTDADTQFLATVDYVQTKVGATANILSGGTIDTSGGSADTDGVLNLKSADDSASGGGILKMLDSTGASNLVLNYNGDLEFSKAAATQNIISYGNGAGNALAIQASSDATVGSASTLLTAASASGGVGPGATDTLTLTVGSGCVFGNNISGTTVGDNGYFIDSEGNFNTFTQQVELDQNGDYKSLLVAATACVTRDTMEQYVGEVQSGAVGSIIAGTGIDISSSGNGGTGNVTINADLGNGLDLDGSDKIQVDTNDDSLTVDANGIVVNLGSTGGLSLSTGASDATDGIGINSSDDSLTVDTNGVVVNLGSAGGLSLSTGAGDTTDGIKINSNDDSLTVDTNGVRVNIAADKGLELNSTDGIGIDLGTDSGLEFVSTGTAAAKGLIVSIGSNPGGSNPDTQTLKIDDNGNLAVDVDVVASQLSGDFVPIGGTGAGAVTGSIAVNAAAITSGVLDVSGLADTTAVFACAADDLTAGDGTQSYDFATLSLGGAAIGKIKVTDTGVKYMHTSDYRLKENVVTDWCALSDVNRLRPSKFNFISTPNETVTGFIAHELQQVIPHAVEGLKDATNYFGQPIYQSVDQAKIVPLLTKGVQELDAKNNQLEQTNELLNQRLAVLENENTKLRKEMNELKKYVYGKC